MSAKQDDARLFERNPALNGNLPEVLVQHQQDAGLGFGKIQQDGILPSGAIGPGPPHIVAADAKCLDRRANDPVWRVFSVWRRACKLYPTGYN